MISGKIVILFICVLTVLFVSAFENSSRVRRAQGATLSKILYRFEALAHITSAASLEIGLTNGEIDSDKVIAELLHMGALEIQDVSKLDQAAITKSIGTLQSLREDLNGKQEILDIENRLVVLEELGKLPPWTEDFKNFKGKQEYVAFLKKMVDLANTKTLVSGYKTIVGNLVGGFKTLEDLSKNIDSELSYALTKFPAITADLTYLQNKLQNSDTVVAQLKKAKEVIEKSKFINLLTAEYKYRTEKLMSTFDYDAEMVKILLANFAKVQNVAKDSESSKNHFQTIQQLIDSRKSLAKLSFEYTAGLPRGSEDLVKLNRDSMDEWIKMRVSNGSLVSECLSKAFAHFEDLASTLKTVETSWNPLGQSESIEKIAKTQLALSSVPKDLQTVTGHLNELETCETTHRPYPSPKFETIKDTLTSIDRLNVLVAQLNTLENISQFKKLSVLQKNFDLSKVSDKEKTAKEVVGKMGTDPELIKGIQDLKDFQTNLTNVETSLTNIATEISKIDIPKIEKYHTEAAFDLYLGLYPCLNKEIAKGSGVKDLIQVIRNLRDLLKQIDTSELQSLYSSKSQIEKVQNSIEKIKEIEDREVKNLEESFKDSVQVSKSFGMGVQGLLAIKTAADAKSDLTPLLELLKDASGYPVLLKILQKLALTYQGIENFLGTISSFDGFRRRRGVDFRSDSKVFEEAAKIQSCQIDMKTLRNAIEAVNKNGKYSAAMTSLGFLEKLDLNFVKFNFKDAAASMEAIDQFFTSYASSMALLPSSAPPQMVPVDPTSSDFQGLVMTTTYMSREEVPNSTWEENKGYFIGGIIVFIIVIVGVSLLFWFCCPHVCCSSCMDDPDDVIHDDVENPPLNQTPKTELAKPAAPEKDEKTRMLEEHDKALKEPSRRKSSKKYIIIPFKKQEKKQPEVKQPEVKQPENDERPVKRAKNQNMKGNAQQRKRSKSESSSRLISEKGPSVRVNYRDAKLKNYVPPRFPVSGVVFNQVTEQNNDELFKFGDELSADCLDNCNSKRYPDEWALENYIKVWNKTASRNLHRGEFNQNLPERVQYDMFCDYDTMAQIEGFDENPYVNISQVDFGETSRTFEKKFVFAAQNPLDRNEPEEEASSSRKICTMEKHMAVMEQKKIGIVVQLYPFEVEGKRRSARYYSEKVNQSKTFGRYTLTTLKRDENLDGFSKAGAFRKYKILLTNNLTQTKVQFDVLHYHWTTPTNPKIPWEILDYVDRYDCNSMIHCRNGVSATGVLLACKYASIIMKTGVIRSLDDIVKEVRNYRRGVIHTPYQMVYLILCIFTKLMEVRKIDFYINYAVFEVILGRILDPSKYREMNTKGKSSPQTYATECKNIEKYRDKQAAKYLKKLEADLKAKKGKEEKSEKFVDPFPELNPVVQEQPEAPPVNPEQPKQPVAPGPPVNIEQQVKPEQSEQPVVPGPSEAPNQPANPKQASIKSQRQKNGSDTKERVEVKPSEPKKSSKSKKSVKKSLKIKKD